MVIKLFWFNDIKNLFYVVFTYSNLFAEISPVCAIMGGVLAQEIVKVVTEREAPHNNFFFFNPEKCCGFIETHSCTD